METINEEIQPQPETPGSPAHWQAKRVFIGFAITVVVGLAIAGWYVGGRILAAQKAHPIAMTKPALSAPKIAEPVVAAAPVAEPASASVEQPKPASADLAQTWNTVDPQPGELYLQLATMGPHSTNDYLKTLDTKGIHPRIAPGPSENLHRLVMGPYPDKAEREKEQLELQTAGVEFMPHRY
jgi:cell division septation protein DedD